MGLDGTNSRSVANSVNNTTFTDLMLTQYPAGIDSRDNNKNMEGFINIQDALPTTPLDKMWNMAEHVNALADAVMAIQRVLGINPQLDVDGRSNTEGTVSGRIDLLEDPDRYDSRYGGEGWILSQTLIGHTHTHENGHPSKILLTDSSEIQGLLPKANIDLTTDTGLTGDDIAVGKKISTKIADAVADKLSVSQGGTINNNLTVLGKFRTKTHYEWNNLDVINGTKKADEHITSSGVFYRGAGTEEVIFINDSLDTLEYGKYVVGVRLRTNSLASEVVAYVNVYNYIGGKTVAASMQINGTDFDDTNNFKMFYLVCDINGDASNSKSSIKIAKDGTASDTNIDFDHAFIMPVHPAIFDK